jgi:hypothetical protein
MTVTYNGLILDVEFEYFGAYRNPVGRHPHEREQEHGAYVELDSVCLGENELIDLLSEEALDGIAEEVLKEIQSRD